MLTIAQKLKSITRIINAEIDAGNDTDAKAIVAIYEGIRHYCAAQGIDYVPLQWEASHRYHTSISTIPVPDVMRLEGDAATEAQDILNNTDA